MTVKGTRRTRHRIAGGAAHSDVIADQSIEPQPDKRRELRVRECLHLGTDVATSPNAGHRELSAHMYSARRAVALRDSQNRSSVVEYREQRRGTNALRKVHAHTLCDRSTTIPDVKLSHMQGPSDRRGVHRASR